MNRPGLLVGPLLASVLVLTGCGTSVSSSSTPPPLATASISATALPTGWPAVAFPEGTSIVSSATGADPGAPRLAVSFESQELPGAVAAFLDKQLTAAGFTSGGTSTDSAGTTTVRYSAGTQTATLEIGDATTTTEGSLVITTAVASATPAA